MSTYLHLLITAVGDHRLLIYALVATLALSESLPLIGALVPGTALILGVSTLVPSGAVALLPLLAAAITGAVIGDGLSYWLGHHYQDRLVRLWPFTRHPRLLPRGAAFFHRHGGKSVFLARFTPGVRALVPLVAGILQMPVARFYSVNIASALVWAPVHIIPAALVGFTLALSGAVAMRLALFLALLLIGLWLILSLTRLLLHRGLPLLNRLQQQLWQWSQASDGWLRRPLRSLLDPQRTEAQGLLLSAALLIGSLWLFAGILEDVVSGDPLVRLDSSVFHLLQTLRTTWSDQLMIRLTELGDSAVTVTLTGAVLVWLLWRRAWSSAAYWVGAVGCSALATLVLKLALHRPRPVTGLYHGWSAFSFPSGHTVVNATLYGFLAFLIAREVRSIGRAISVAGALLVAVAIAFSRLYLGAHWLSDVAAGLAFAVAWVTILAIAYNRHQRPSLPPLQLVAVVLVTLVIAGGIHTALRYPRDLARYAQQPHYRWRAATAWWQGGWRRQAAWRLDLDGARKAPFSVQWAGPPSALRETLLAHGWQQPPPWSVSGALAWLAPHPRSARLPVLPQLDDGQPATLTLVKPASHGRLIVRLWTTHTRLTGTDQQWPLLIGSVVRERFVQPYALLTLGRAETDFNQARATLAQALPGARLARRTAATPDWDGKVLLLTAPAVAASLTPTAAQ